MNRAQLRELAIDDGRRLLKALDENDFPFNAALWSYSSDRERWRLLIATEIFDKRGPLEAYQQISQIRAHQDIPLSLQDVTVISSHDPLIRVLKSVVSTGVHDIKDIELTAQMLDHVYVDDAYIYRMA